MKKHTLLMPIPFARLSYLKHSTGYIAWFGVQPAEYTNPKTKIIAICARAVMPLLATTLPSGPSVTFVALSPVMIANRKTMMSVEKRSWGLRPMRSVIRAPKMAPLNWTTFWRPWSRSRVLFEEIPAPCSICG